MFRVNLRFLYSFAFAPGLGLVLGIFLPKGKCFCKPVLCVEFSCCIAYYI